MFAESDHAIHLTKRAEYAIDKVNNLNLNFFMFQNLTLDEDLGGVRVLRRRRRLLERRPDYGTEYCLCF